MMKISAPSAVLNMLTSVLSGFQTLFVRDAALDNPRRGHWPRHPLGRHSR